VCFCLNSHSLLAYLSNSNPSPFLDPMLAKFIGYFLFPRQWGWIALPEDLSFEMKVRSEEMAGLKLTSKYFSKRALKVLWKFWPSRSLWKYFQSFNPSQWDSHSLVLCVVPFNMILYWPHSFGIFPPPSPDQWGYRVFRYYSWKPLIAFQFNCDTLLLLVLVSQPCNFSVWSVIHQPTMYSDMNKFRPVKFYIS